MKRQRSKDSRYIVETCNWFLNVLRRKQCNEILGSSCWVKRQKLGNCGFPISFKYSWSYILSHLNQAFSLQLHYGVVQCQLPAAKLGESWYLLCIRSWDKLTINLIKFFLFLFVRILEFDWMPLYIGCSNLKHEQRHYITILRYIWISFT